MNKEELDKLEKYNKEELIEYIIELKKSLLNIVEIHKELIRNKDKTIDNLRHKEIKKECHKKRFFLKVK